MKYQKSWKNLQFAIFAENRSLREGISVDIIKNVSSVENLLAKQVIWRYT